MEPFAFVRGGIINFFKVDNDDIVPIVTGSGFGINIGYEVSTVFLPFVSIKYTTLTFEAGEDVVFLFGMFFFLIIMKHFLLNI